MERTAGYAYQALIFAQASNLCSVLLCSIQSTLSQKSATVAEFSRCLAVFGDSRTFLRQCGQGFTCQLVGGIMAEHQQYLCQVQLQLQMTRGAQFMALAQIQLIAARHYVFCIDFYAIFKNLLSSFYRAMLAQSAVMRQ